MKDDPSQVSQAVRKLRLALGESQQAFAYRMKAAVRTIARWETTRPPKGKALSDLNGLALENNQWELARILGDALADELGLSAERALDNAENLVLEDLMRRAQLSITDYEMGDKVKAKAGLNYIKEEINKLIKSTEMRTFPPRVPAPASSEIASDEQTRPKERSDEK